jgi:hypothetical protein
MRAHAIAFALFAMAGSCTHARIEVPGFPVKNSPLVSRFIARPEVIHKGQKVVLTWNTKNATDVLLEEAADAAGGAPDEMLHEIGRFPASGTHEVRPELTTRYVISCGSEPVGCAAASVTVLVK